MENNANNVITDYLRVYLRDSGLEFTKSEIDALMMDWYPTRHYSAAAELIEFWTRCFGNYYASYCSGIGLYTVTAGITGTGISARWESASWPEAVSGAVALCIAMQQGDTEYIDGWLRWKETAGCCCRDGSQFMWRLGRWPER